MSSLYNIEKLDGENYSAWQLQMKSVLIHCDLWQYTSGTNVLPADSKTPEHSAWKLADGKALATVLLCVKSSELLHVKHCVTSKEAWEKFKEIYQPIGPARKVTLFKQLVQHKMREGQSMTNHLNSFFDLLEKLSETQVKLSDELLVIFLLCSLPENYDNFIVAIESRDNLPNLSALKIKLLEEDHRRSDKDLNNIDQSNQHVLLTKTKNSNNNSYKANGKAKHNFKCYFCGKKGHFASNCRNKNSKEKSDSSETKSAAGIFTLKSSNILMESEWCLDSGATSHMCCDKSSFVEFKSGTKQKIHLASDGTCECEGIGKIVLETIYGKITLIDVLFVPKLKGNFMSVSKITHYNNSVEFKGENALVRNAKGELMVNAKKRGDLFIVQLKKQREIACHARECAQDVLKWHERFGHLNGASLQKLNSMVIGLEVKNIPNKIDCITCAKSKICCQSFPNKASTHSKEILNLIHTDICGPMKCSSAGGARYFATFIDDRSRKIFVYFLKTRDEIFGVFKQFKAMVELETSCKIKAIRSDNGREYVSNIFSNYLKENGIKRQLTAEYTPQQNGVAERANRTLMEMARCFLLDSNLPDFMWAEAINSAAYIRNRSPTQMLGDKTPFEVWTGRKPVVSHFKVFGCKAIVLYKKAGRSKLQPKGDEFIMVGYSEEAKAYRLYDPKTRKIIKSRDVIFFESLKKDCDLNNSTDFVPDLDFMGSLNEPDVNREQGEVISEETDNDKDAEIVDSEIIIGPGRPKIIRTGKPGRPTKQYNVLNVLSENKIPINNNPTSVQEAMSRSDSNQWSEAMKLEFDSLTSNKTWELVSLPKNARVIGCKWVYTIKRNVEGEIDRYKARLVAKGCSQKYNIDFFETYSPVVRYSTIRLILAIAVHYKLLIHHMDVTAAYLNGELEDVVYMAQPEGFVDKIHPEKVCKLKKSLYGLKQSGREWNKRLDNVLINIGFKRCNGDSCIYTMNECDEINIIAVYVDDLIITCTTESTLNKIKGLISSEFDTIDKGKLSHYLGIYVERDGERGKINLNQKQYILNLLQKYQMEECRQSYTPLDPGEKLFKCSDDNCKIHDQSEYQSLIGALMFIAITTRPDIMHSVSKLSQFNSRPHTEHFTAAKRLLRYLAHTKEAKFEFASRDNKLIGFVDSDWGSDHNDRKSYTGFVFFLCGSVITWESKKQTSVALSSTEAEYMALSQACKEAVYLKNLISELGFEELVKDPIKLNNDNLSSQQLVKNTIYHSRSKHIDIKYHYTREIYTQKLIELSYIQTDEMSADILTKN